MKHLRGRPTLSGCAKYCLRVVGLLWAVLGVPGAPSGRVWPVGSGGVASRGCIHTSKIVSQKVHPSLTFTPKITVKYNPLSNPSLPSLKRQLTTQVNNTPIQALGVTLNEPLLPAHACSVGLCSRRNAVTVHFKLALARVPAISAAVWHIGTFLEHSDGATRS